LHPTHPVLAYGPKADWIVADHEQCVFPCGPGTPFEKLLNLRGKVLFFDVPFSNFTFVHYLEHLMKDRLPFPLYSETVFQVPVIDCTGVQHTVATAAFSHDTIRRRRIPIFEAELRRCGIIRDRRIGNTNLLCVEASDTVECAEDMAQRNTFFYDLSDCPAHPPRSS
jgi:aminoglycoside 3-N-acetyltransferase